MVLLLTLAIWISLSLVLPQSTTFASSLQTGLLDPIPLMHRSLNLALLPLLDSAVESLSPVQRHYELALLIGAVFLTAIFLNLWIPRFYCRFICPLGALLGLLGRHAIWRIGKTKSDCPQCRLCDRDCEGGCNPSEQIHTGECVLCMNCYNQCTHDIIHYQTRKSAAGEIASADISRRGFILSVLSGLAAPSLMRISGITGANWNPAVIRPPGALIEQEFLARCVKCGQCMKICPTNVLQPASLQAGIEGLWTPVLNNRIGTSGCQLNCTACSTVCPTSAIRRITLDEKLGRGEHTRNGPIKLGTAFVDRSRCLPWAMETPCIVCQENCPLSPKAIHLREEYVTVRGGRVSVRSVDGPHIEVEGEPLIDGKYATGDYYIRFSQAAPDSRHRIVQNTSHDITLAKEISSEATPNAGSTVQIQVRLQRPHVDPRACIGCGVCEHECPVAGKRAIRVSAENESRSRDRRMLLN